MRFRLRTLLILLALFPPVLAAAWHAWQSYAEQRQRREFDKLIDLISTTIVPVSSVLQPGPAWAVEPIQRLFPFRDTAGWGYIDREGKVVVAPQYRQAQDFSDGLGQVTIASGSTSFVDATGAVVLELGNQFPILQDFSEGRAAFSIDGKWGYIDRRGKIVIAARYDKVQSFSEGRAAVNLGATLKREFPRDYLAGGKWGFVDASGKLVIPAEYDYVEFHGFREGLALVRKGKEEYAYIDKQGRTVFKLHDNFRDSKRWIASVRHFSEGLAHVNTSGYPGFTGFVDKTGEFVIEPRFIAGLFSEGLCPFTVDGKSGYFDKRAKTVIEPQFEVAELFSEGLAVAGKEEQLSYIDKLGRVVIPGPFNDAEPFRGGLARVHVGGSFVITHDGPAYWTGGTWHYINPQGEKIHSCRTDDDAGATSYGRELR
jgi:hypothetical protein